VKFSWFRLTRGFGRFDQIGGGVLVVLEKGNVADQDAQNQLQRLKHGTYITQVTIGRPCSLLTMYRNIYSTVDTHGV
jgi:hypothetical protein